jgi:hypothetical protein
MSLSLYPERHSSSTPTALTLNLCTAQKTTFQRLTTPIDVENAVSASKSQPVTSVPYNAYRENEPNTSSGINGDTPYDNMICTDRSIHRFCVSNDPELSAISISFNSIYYRFGVRMGYLQNSTKVNISKISPESVERLFYSVSDMEFRYSIITIDPIKRYIDHNVLSELIKEYLINNNICLFHDQEFLIPYRSSIMSVEMIIGIKISPVETSCSSRKNYLNMMESKGIRFNKSQSKNIVLTPDTSSLKSYIYMTLNPVNSLKIIWSCVDTDDNASCTFMDEKVIKNLIINTLRNISFKAGFSGYVRYRKQHTVNFVIESVNSVTKNTDYSSVFHISNEPNDFIHTAHIQYESDDTKITIKVSPSDMSSSIVPGVMYLTTTDSKKVIDFTSDVCSDATDITDLQKDMKIELLHEPSQNSNVISIDSSKDSVPATSLTIDIECISSTNKVTHEDEYILWKKENNKVIVDLLSQNQKLGSSDIVMNTGDGNGRCLKFFVVNCEPRNQNLIGRYYGSTSPYFYSESDTKLIIRPKKIVSQKKF